MRDYVYNFLKYAKLELEKNSTGSTFKAVNKDVLSSLTCLIPDNEELIKSTKRLKSILSSNELLESKILISKALQKSLFQPNLLAMAFNELNSVEHYIIHQLSGVSLKRIIA